MADRGSILKEREIKQGFETLGICPASKGAYVGAESFGASFKRCSILKDVPTVYSWSTYPEK